MAIAKEKVKKSINFDYESDVSNEFNCNITYSVNDSGVAILELDYGNNVFVELPVEMVTDIYDFLIEEKLIVPTQIRGFEPRARDPQQIPKSNNNLSSTSICPTQINKKNRTGSQHKSEKNLTEDNSGDKQQKNVSSDTPKLESLSDLGNLGTVIQEPIANTAAGADVNTTKPGKKQSKKNK